VSAFNLSAHCRIIPIFVLMLKFLLSPFALLYGIAIFVRNELYDLRILKGFEFDFPVICIGNLSVGGTGKTPHTEYIIDLLYEFFPVGVISRGYGRHTNGYLLADENSSAADIGDEPMQMKTNYPDVAFAVGEDRHFAIPQLIRDVPETKVILLDDAFQHRAVKAGLNILLTDYNHLYSNDWLLPVGRLREFRSGSNRAEVIVVTKCPATLSANDKETIIGKLKPETNQKVFFSTLNYRQPFYFSDRKKTVTLEKNIHTLIVCGIADSNPLEKFLSSKTTVDSVLNFGDHHFYNKNDIEKIYSAFAKIKSDSKLIITTQKDAVKLNSFKSIIEENKLPLYVQPVRPEFEEEERKQFSTLIFDYVSKYYSEVEATTNN
jgi:tetraacyldisaccharide 4'-kinase